MDAVISCQTQAAPDALQSTHFSCLTYQAGAVQHIALSVFPVCTLGSSLAKLY